VILGAAESIRTRTGTPRAAQESADADRAAGAAADALGDEAFAEAVDRGRHLSVQDALGAA
jgi:hypothetical protein